MASEKIIAFLGGGAIGLVSGGMFLWLALKLTAGAKQNVGEPSMIYEHLITTDTKAPEPSVKKRGGLFGIKKNIIIGLVTHPEKYSMSGEVVGDKLIFTVLRKEN